MLAGEGTHVGSLNYGREIQSISGLPNYPFICLAVPPTKLVVEVGDEKLPSILFCQVINYVQQDNRIQAARDRDQNRLAPPKQLAPLDVFADPAQKLTHGTMHDTMLFRRDCEAKQNEKTEGELPSFSDARRFGHPVRPRGSELNAVLTLFLLLFSQQLSALFLVGTLGRHQFQGALRVRFGPGG